MNDSIVNARKWKSDPNDRYGRDKELFLKYMSKHCVGLSRAKSIDLILRALGNRLSTVQGRESFQHNILVPLREKNGFFIGTGNKGLYLIKNSSDALKTISFYARRIKSEEKHLKNLMNVLKQTKYSQKIIYPKSEKNICDVYFDESGKPTLNNKEEEPYFIVCAIIINNKNNRYNLLDKKFSFIKKEFLKKPNDYEIKHNNLNDKKHKLVLEELSTIDYEFAAAVFIKQRLNIDSFSHPKSFYKFANQFLIDKILTSLGRVNLYFDNYSGKDEQTEYDKEFTSYIKRKNLFWPDGKINELKLIDSKMDNRVQMVDLVAGAIRKFYMKGNYSLLSLIENKKIDIYHFPNTVDIND